MSDISLMFIKGPKQGTTVKLQNGFRVGRDPECEIFIDDSALSKQHLVFDIINNQVVIKDLQSSNGTFVNGKKVLKAALSHNDEISFGRNMTRISLSDAAPAPGAPVQAAASKPKPGGKPDGKSKEPAVPPAEKAGRRKKLLFNVLIVFLVLAIGLVAVKTLYVNKKRQEPITFQLANYRHIDNVYSIKYPLGWRRDTFTDSYFRTSGAFDYFLAKFQGTADGFLGTFAVDMLKGFSYDTELEDITDVSASRFPRYYALPREAVKKTNITFKNIPAIRMESIVVDKERQQVFQVVEIYFLVKNNITIKSNQKLYALPQKTRYILIAAFPQNIYSRVQASVENVLNSLDMVAQALPSGAITDISRSEMSNLYDERIKRSEQLLDNTTIDIGNLYRALMHYKEAIWIAVEYENLGGSSKLREGLISKTVNLHSELLKKYDDYAFNIKKGYNLRDRKLIVDSAQNIMKLFPETDNYKYIEANRIYYKFKKR
jgi:hypothetical protein